MAPPAPRTRREGAPKPAYRVKFEQSNPTIAFRLPLELHRKLAESAASAGKSLSTVIREALEPELREPQADYRRGYAHGFKIAKEKFSVTYPCSQCGAILLLTSEEERAIVADAMRWKGYRHVTCPTRGLPPG